MSALSTMPTFADRKEAGTLLAEALVRYGKVQDLVILALPRGGVPVAAEIAASLGKPFDVLVVRKLGVPGHEEVAMGAIAPGGICVLSHELIHTLGLGTRQVDAVIERETTEIARREQRFCQGRSMPAISGHTVMVVDDGAATGSTMSAAVLLLRHLKAKRIVLAIPVAPGYTIERLRDEADDVVVLREPFPFHSVGEWYEDFAQTRDEEVERLLESQAVARAPAKPAPGSTMPDKQTLDHLRKHVVPLTGAADDYDGLLEMIGDASVVLLGESTHGTHEFYRERAEITKRLIVEKQFNAVAVEADWPDAYRVNRFVRGVSADATCVDALAGFERFPSWMWRNADMLDFIGWLADYNDNYGIFDHQVGFYGLDLYSLHKSMGEVIAYLEARDPDEAAKARHLYSCVERHGDDPQLYGMRVARGLSEGCRMEMVRQLANLRRKEAALLASDGESAADEFFCAAQNARLARNAEQYYRTMFDSDVSSWNLRDEHMMETLVELLAHLHSRQGSAKVIVWAHNSHLGDARATAMSHRGEWNIGQLVRLEFGRQSRLIGFTTYTGTVTAAPGWHLPAGRKQVRPGIKGGIEHLFHQVGPSNFWIDLTHDNEAVDALETPRPERAIGVVYHTETDRHSHYFDARLSRQFDAVIHFDHTRAVEPLERTAEWEEGELPETYPAGL